MPLCFYFVDDSFDSLNPYDLHDFPSATRVFTFFDGESGVGHYLVSFPLSRYVKNSTFTGLPSANIYNYNRGDHNAIFWGVVRLLPVAMEKDLIVLHCKLRRQTQLYPL